MHKQKPTITQGSALAVLALPLLALAVTGCGIGRAGDKEKISKTATTYLSALAAGDTAKACAQLTRHARGERCETTTKRRLARLEPDALKDAADGSLDIDVHGKTATAGLRRPWRARSARRRAAGVRLRLSLRARRCRASRRPHPSTRRVRAGPGVVWSSSRTVRPSRGG